MAGQQRPQNGPDSTTKKSVDGPTWKLGLLVPGQSHLLEFLSQILVHLAVGDLSVLQSFSFVVSMVSVILAITCLFPTKTRILKNPGFVSIINKDFEL